MSTMGDIIAELDAVKKDLEAIDLTKETELKKIGGMATKPIQGIDKTVKMEGFGEEHLEKAVNMFKEASDKVGTYDTKKDVAEARKSYGDMKKLEEINDRMKARESVKTAIQGKYQELSSKKAVIEKYTQKFNPKHLVNRQNRKLEAINKKIEANEKRMVEISDFKNKVSGELGTVKTNLALIGELTELENLAQAVKDREDKFNDAKARGFGKELLAGLEEDLNNSKKALKIKTDGITKKYKGVTLDPNSLGTSIHAAIPVAETAISKARVRIEKKISGAEKNFGYTDGFETIMTDKVKNAKDEDLLTVFDDAETQLDEEIVSLDSERGKITKNIDTIQLGMQVKAVGTSKTTIEEPTEEEIQARMNADPEIQALIPTGDDKDRKQKVYESLVGGKKNKSKLLHPIAALKAKFSKKAMEEWENKTYKDEMRRNAIESIKAEREASSSKSTEAVKKVESQQSEFRKFLTSYVMSKDSATVEKMAKDVNKAPGKVLVDVYKQMEAKAESETEEEVEK